MEKKGAGEELSSEVTASITAYDPVDDDELLPWEGQKSDGGEDDKSSEYSSCGGESEFERYCSANSAMGTPSVCSSSVYEFADSEFGSLKSFKLGGENGNLKNFGVGKKLSSFNDPGSSSSISYSRSDFSDGKKRNDDENFDGFLGTSKGLGLYDNSGDFLNHGEVFVENDEAGGILGNQEDFWGNEAGDGNNLMTLPVGAIGIAEGLEGVNSKKEEEFKSDRGVEMVDGCMEGLDLQSRLDDYRGDVGRFSDEDETSTRYEHSEGEDSMFGSGSDDAKKADTYCIRNVKYSRGEGHCMNENELFMTSAVAFGSDDFDDFMQETGGNALSMTVLDEVHDEKQEISGSEVGCLDSAFADTVVPSGLSFSEQQEEVVDIPRTSYQVQDNSELAKSVDDSSSNTLNPLKFGEVDQVHGEDAFDKGNQMNGANELAKHPATCFVHNKDGMDQGSLTEEVPPDIRLLMGNTEMEEGHQLKSKGQVTSNHDDLGIEHVDLEKTDLVCDPLSDNVVTKCYSTSRESTEDKKDKVFTENETSSTSLLADTERNLFIGNSPALLNQYEDYFSPVTRGNYNEFYDETVNEMEQILLDAGKSPGSRFTQGRTIYQPQIPVPSRDGGSTASTSGTDDVYPLIELPQRIDGVEVVGARQKQGDVSLSERLVGVKEYTVYKIRVWSGEEIWEVERRYRDFYTLYRQLKKLFVDQGMILPPPWSSVEQESRKIFCNASPVVIAERSVLIQECLQSILHSNISTISLNALLHFLSPSKADPSSPPSATPLSQSQLSSRGREIENVSMLGNTISLVVQIQPYKSVKQMLDTQHNTCAGCHKNFDEGRSRMKELVRTLGWGKPRLCEYSGQLFCSSCHTNDTAVLPARVLHLWDFAEYPVSQLAKSYLDSIYDKPMICVGAVNPVLFSRVPALQHVTNVRKRIGVMLPFVRCPFRRSIHKGLGSRRYLLEGNDFFALRDLIDLSKGLFAALPVIVETVSKKIQEHITEQCLICCDTGIPCNARQACNDPSSLIFPFQEGEVERCRSCDSVFHRHCFRRIVTCPCGARLKPEEDKGITAGIGHGFASDVLSTLKSTRKAADASPGFLSGLFSKTMPQSSLGHIEGPKDSNTVILMGSLPSTSL
ncbi:hypothetical protein ACH5RR_025531 [Cinchona calisaya]|uniref:PX domain-containing protein n=1 Tax=Cinchona calisaya TaxID=153742 RepID=A0ABD2Z2A5_9GENT